MRKYREVGVDEAFNTYLSLPLSQAERPCPGAREGEACGSR